LANRLQRECCGGIYTIGRIARSDAAGYPKMAAAMFAGEQPGNDEELSGHPFTGPAGKLPEMP
jgi:uracil-DNA glycosylase family 4